MTGQGVTGLSPVTEPALARATRPLAPVRVTAARVRAIVAANPDLDPTGYRAVPDRADLAGRAFMRQVRDSAAFLAGLEPTERATKRSPGSYGLKHEAERAAGRYVGNGALIVAALLLDLPVRRYAKDSPNAAIGVAVR